MSAETWTTIARKRVGRLRVVGYFRSFAEANRVAGRNASGGAFVAPGRIACNCDARGCTCETVYSHSERTDKRMAKRFDDTEKSTILGRLAGRDLSMEILDQLDDDCLQALAGAFGVDGEQEEEVPAPGTKDAKAFAEETAKVQRFAESNKDFAHALKAAGRTPADYVGAFKSARRKNPRLTAAQYGVPG